MNIAVIGAGGVGGYFGGKLANSQNDVTFFARGHHLEYMLKNGLEIKSIKGDFIVNPVKATSDYHELAGVDLIILSVKAWQVKDIAHHLKPVIGTNTMVLPLQNGISTSDELKEILPANNVLAGLCRIISKIESPGVINHFAIEPTIVLGEINNHKSDRIIRLNEIFKNAGFNSHIAGDIQVELWKKFISICVSGLLAITRSSYGELRDLPETREMMHQLFKEIVNLAHAYKINIKRDYADKLMEVIDTFAYDSTSSLSRDIIEGKPSELEYQNGSVVRLADKMAVDVPVNRFIYSSLLLAERRARKGEK